MPDTPGTSSFQTTFGNMTDSQLRQTISQLSSAAATPYSTYRSPAPQAAGTPTYFEPKQWSATATKTRGRNRASRSAAASSAQTHSQPTYQQPHPPVAPSAPSIPAGPTLPPNPPWPPLPTTPQALQTTYPSRLRTGTTLLVQPILATTTNTAAGGRTGTRRGGIINYADPGSGDEMDAGAVDTDDSDFVASGGTRTAIRASRSGRPWNVPAFHAFQAQQPGTSTQQGKQELDQTYLGMIPPSRFISAKRAEPTRHEYPSQESLEEQAMKPTALVPIRVEFETDTHRIRDCFVWNLHEKLLKPDAFAKVLCADLDLPVNPWAETITNQIRAQIEEHEGVASMDLRMGMDVDPEAEPAATSDVEEEFPECRVILSIDVQIATYHLLDHIEWDLLSPLTPEHFAQKLCADIGLAGEAAPLVAHALHEEILRHKKDSIEWGVIGGDVPSTSRDVAEEAPRDKSGLGLVKDKTGLGLGGWGRTPKDGRGPKALRSVWKDWSEAEEFGTRFEVLSAEEVERREIERERASRRLRRETSKFQYQSTTTRRRR